MFPHDVDDGGTDQRVLDDERVEVRGRVLDDRAHDVHPAAANCGRVGRDSGGGRDEGGREQRVQAFVRLVEAAVALQIVDVVHERVQERGSGRGGGSRCVYPTGTGREGVLRAAKMVRGRFVRGSRLGCDNVADSVQQSAGSGGAARTSARLYPGRCRRRARGRCRSGRCGRGRGARRGGRGGRGSRGRERGGTDQRGGRLGNRVCRALHNLGQDARGVLREQVLLRVQVDADRFPLGVGTARGKLHPHHHARVAQRVLPDVLQYDRVFRLRAAALMVGRDLLERFQHQRANPDADVGGHDMHQPEPGQHLEAMYVELLPAKAKKKQNKNLC